MKLSELNIGDKFSVDIDEGRGYLFGDTGNYMKISSNPNNFKITHHDEWHDMNNYCFVLNLDTSTLGILLKTQEVDLND